MKKKPCESCTYETYLKPYDRNMVWQTDCKNKGIEPIPMLLCKVCANSLIGNAYNYGPEIYPDIVVLQTLGYCTNLIISEIRKRTKRI